MFENFRGNSPGTPAIALSCDFEASPSNGEAPYFFLKKDYIDAVREAGGIPLLLPHGEEEEIVDFFSHNCNGLILTGGDFDVPPAHYGEAALPQMGKVIEKRTQFELLLLRRAIEESIPVLGICGGHQLINVEFGGNLYQDLPSQRKESIDHNPGLSSFTHPVTIEKGSFLGNILQSERVEVNSTHHQAIKNVAPGFRVSAKADDGVVEAIEREEEDGFLLGIQWHPEFTRKRDSVFSRIFEALVEAASVRST